MAKKATTKAANQTRAQKAKALHEKNSAVRAGDQAALKAMFMADKDNPLIANIIETGKGLIRYHVKIAQDGVGARKTGYKLENGTDEVENYVFSNDEIAGEMKRAAGLQELIDYIERQQKLPDPSMSPKKVQ